MAVSDLAKYYGPGGSGAVTGSPDVSWQWSGSSSGTTTKKKKLKRMLEMLEMLDDEESYEKEAEDSGIVPPKRVDSRFPRPPGPDDSDTLYRGVVRDVTGIEPPGEAVDKSKIPEPGEHTLFKGGKADEPPTRWKEAESPTDEDAAATRRKQYNLMRELETANLPVVRDRWGNEIHPESQFGGGAQGDRSYPDQPFGGYFQTYREQARALGYNPEVYARSGGFIGKRGPFAQASRNINLLDVLESRGVDPGQAKLSLTKIPPISPSPGIGRKSFGSGGGVPGTAPARTNLYTRHSPTISRFPELAGMFDLFRDFARA